MDTLESQFVTYPIALKLKELGFDESCLAFYSGQLHHLEIGFNWINDPNCKNSIIENIISAHLWQQVQSFLDDNGVIIGIIFVDNVFKYTLNTNNYVSNGFKDRMSAIKNATEYATNYLWNKKFNK